MARFSIELYLRSEDGGGTINGSINVVADDEESAVETFLEAVGENLSITREAITYQVNLTVHETFSFEFVDEDGEYDDASSVEEAFRNGDLDYNDFQADGDDTEVYDAEVYEA